MNPRRVAADVKLHLRIWWRFRSRLLLGFAIPAIFMVMLGSFAGEEPIKPVLHVVDLDRSAASFDLLQRINATNAVILVSATDHPPVEGAREWVRDNQWAGALWIPQGFEAGLGSPSAMDRSNVSLFVDPRLIPASMILEISFRAVAAQANLELAGVETPFDVYRIYVADRTLLDTEPTVSYRDFLLPGTIGLTVLSVGLFGTVGSMSAFRNTNYFTKLSTTPFRKAEWIVSKMIVNLVMTLLGTLVLMAISLTLFKTHVHFTPLVFAIIAGGSLVFSGIGLLIAGAIRDTDTANLVTNVVYIPMMFLSGTIFEISQLPTFLAAVAQVLPLTFFTEGLRATLLLNDTSTGVRSLLLMLAVAVGCIVVGSRTTSWSEAD